MNTVEQAEAIEQFQNELLAILATAGAEGVPVYRLRTEHVQRPALDPDGLVRMRRELNLGRPETYPAGRMFYEQSLALEEFGLVQLQRSKRHDPEATVEEVRAFITERGRAQTPKTDRRE